MVVQVEEGLVWLVMVGKVLLSSGKAVGGEFTGKYELEGM